MPEQRLIYGVQLVLGAVIKVSQFQFHIGTLLRNKRRRGKPCLQKTVEHVPNWNPYGVQKNHLNGEDVNAFAREARAFKNVLHQTTPPVLEIAPDSQDAEGENEHQLEARRSRHTKNSFRWCECR